MVAILNEKTIGKTPQPYLDTNVILDYIRKRNDESFDLLSTIKKRKIKSWTSHYTTLELVDKQQEEKWYKKIVFDEGGTIQDALRQRRSRKLTYAELQEVFVLLKKKFFTPFVDSGIVDMVNLKDNNWDNIMDLLGKKNYSTADAIHVDSALVMQCNIFISNDQDLIKFIEQDKLIPVASPKNLEKVLEHEGISPIILS